VNPGNIEMLHARVSLKRHSTYNLSRYETKDVLVEAEQNFDIAKKWIKKFFR